MATIKLKYINEIISRGRHYYYYRRGTQKIPLPSDPSSVEFAEAYKRINDSFETNANMGAAVAPGSIAALVNTFKTSAEFKELKPRVRELYAHYLDMVSEKLGPFPARALTRRVIHEWRDNLVSTPAMANNLLAAIKRVYAFGIERGLVKDNPALQIKRLKIGEWRPWKPEEIAAFRKAAPPPMLLAMELAVYTGQRLSDVIAMRWNQITDGGIEVVQKKTGARVWIPIHKNLRTALAKVKKKKSIMILTSATGLPYKANYLKHQFKAAARAAKLPEDLVFHGLRKTAAVMLAEAGCSTEQIKSITGHRTDVMAAYYTRQANQKVLAKSAVRKLEMKK